MFCMFCGAKVIEGSKFCLQCGARLDQDKLALEDTSISIEDVERYKFVQAMPPQSNRDTGDKDSHECITVTREETKPVPRTSDTSFEILNTMITKNFENNSGIKMQESQGNSSHQIPQFKKDLESFQTVEDFSGSQETTTAAQPIGKDENDNTTKIFVGIIVALLVVMVGSILYQSSSSSSNGSSLTSSSHTEKSKDQALQKKEEELAREKEKHEQEVKALEKEKDEFKKERERLQKEMAEARDGSSSSYSSSNSSSYMYGSSSRDYAVRNARRALIDYHKAISDGYISSAYDMLTSHRQEVMGGLSSMRQGYSTTVSSVLTYARPTSISDDSVTFDYKLDAIDNINGRRMYQTFVGDVTMVKIGGRWYMDDMSGRVI